MPILELGLSLFRSLKLVKVDTLDFCVPLRVHVLHVPIEAAELGQELCLVQVPFHCFHVGLDARPLVEAPVSVILRLVQCLAKELIIFQPLFGL